MANLLYRARAEETIERGRGWRAEVPRFEDYRNNKINNEIKQKVDRIRGLSCCLYDFFYN